MADNPMAELDLDRDEFKKLLNREFEKLYRRVEHTISLAPPSLATACPDGLAGQVVASLLLHASLNEGGRADLLVDTTLKTLERPTPENIAAVVGMFEQLSEDCSDKRVLDLLRVGRVNELMWARGMSGPPRWCLPEDIEALQNMLMAFPRASKRAKAEAEAEATKKKKAKDSERLVSHVRQACELAGRKRGGRTRPSISRTCLKNIRPYLPKEWQGLSERELLEALRVARKT